MLVRQCKQPETSYVGYTLFSQLEKLKEKFKNYKSNSYSYNLWFYFLKVVVVSNLFGIQIFLKMHFQMKLYGDFFISIFSFCDNAVKRV